MVRKSFNKYNNKLAIGHLLYFIFCFRKIEFLKFESLGCFLFYNYFSLYSSIIIIFILYIEHKIYKKGGNYYTNNLFTLLKILMIDFLN